MAVERDDNHEQELVVAARSGDLNAFNLLVDRYQRLVFAVCLRTLGDRELAEDATQDTFIRAFNALNDYSGGSLRGWLSRIAVNRCYDLLRGTRRHPLQSLDAQPTDPATRWSSEPERPDPSQHAARAELSRRLSDALNRLPDDQRLAVLLYDVHGYSYEEAAEAASVPIGTIKSRLSRGRARLRDLLRGDRNSRELFEEFSRHSFDDGGGKRP